MSWVIKFPRSGMSNFSYYGFHNQENVHTCKSFSHINVARRYSTEERARKAAAELVLADPMKCHTCWHRSTDDRLCGILGGVEVVCFEDEVKRIFSNKDEHFHLGKKLIKKMTS